MIFTAAAIVGLLTNPTCGGVAPDNDDLLTHMRATVMQESEGDQYAIGVNADVIRGLPATRTSATTAAEAVEKAKALLAQGRQIDLGLSQISDRQLAHHHLTLATAFDECANLRAGAEHLTDDHAWVLAHRRYNCGGINCGEVYAQRVMARMEATPARQPAQVQLNNCPPVWDTFAHAACLQQHAKEH